jgi:hypothetical protein
MDFGQLCSMADDIAVRLARNETRWLSLMSAFPVNSGTARRLANFGGFSARDNRSQTIQASGCAR